MRVWDLTDGDALEMKGVASDSVDFVHSSHCLEHMKDPARALRSWLRVVRPGGHLIVTVPDEDLYEQGIWPSLFNRDHKATFRIDKPESWSPVSFDLRALLHGLRDSEPLSIEKQDAGYDYTLMRHGIGRAGRLAFRLNKLRRNIFRAIGLRSRRLNTAANRLAFRLGSPIDQTLGPAVAQIQAVVKKREAAATLGRA